MSYLVTCTFDLKNASRADYQNAYADLKEIGLERVIVSDQGKEVVMPTTMATGKFNGASVAGVRDDVLEDVRKAFSARGFSSEIFLVAAENWAWGARTT